MRIYMLASLATIFAAACATPEQVPVSTSVATGSDGATSPLPRRRCYEAVTGSRVPKCDRQDVQVLSRDEFERRQSLRGGPRRGMEGLGGQ